jgi:hypothetical protein
MPLPCFSYPAEVPRRMPGGSCFSYPAGSPKRDATRATPRDPRRGYPCFSYPLMCFSYPDDVWLGTGNRDAAQPGLRRMTNTACFRY